MAIITAEVRWYAIWLVMLNHFNMIFDEVQVADHICGRCHGENVWTEVHSDKDMRQRNSQKGIKIDKKNWLDRALVFSPVEYDE